MAKVYSVQFVSLPHVETILPFTALPMHAICTLLQGMLDVTVEDIVRMERLLAKGKSFTFVGDFTQNKRIRATVVVAELG